MSGESKARALDPGESADRRRRESVQPGGREPAPGELSLVQAFINTHYDLEFDHGAELLATPASARRWLQNQRLLPTTGEVGSDDVIRLRAVREALRSLAAANGALAAAKGPGTSPPAALAQLNAAARGAAVEVRFGPGGPRFVAAAPDEVDGALGLLLATTARAMIDGGWSRLKVCPGEDCGWAFYDHSRNQTGRWCSMSVCGGRAKARAHYRRRRRGEAA
jgi:predicted RNA-binding Zn ribbon-like protein